MKFDLQTFYGVCAITGHVSVNLDQKSPIRHLDRPFNWCT
jgi:hypothetical protein